MTHEFVRAKLELLPELPQCVLMKIVEATRDPNMTFLIGPTYLSSDERKRLLARTVYGSVSFEMILRLVCDGDVASLRARFQGGTGPMWMRTLW